MSTCGLGMERRSACAHACAAACQHFANTAGREERRARGDRGGGGEGRGGGGAGGRGGQRRTEEDEWPLTPFCISTSARVHFVFDACLLHSRLPSKLGCSSWRTLPREPCLHSCACLVPSQWIVHVHSLSPNGLYTVPPAEKSHSFNVDDQTVQGITTAQCTIMRS